MKYRLILLYILLLICMVGSACGPAQPTATNAPPHETISPSVIPQIPSPAPTDTQLIRIRLVTTSDWTVLHLVSGASWQRKELIPGGDGATTADMRANQLILDQPVSQAEAGGSIELVVDILLTPQQIGAPVVFRIERGDIGSTQVEISSYVGEEWVAVKNVTWDKVTGNGTNPHNIEIASDELLGKIPVETASQTELESTPVIHSSVMSQGTDGYPWWNDTVFYEIFVRSFHDSNGDGIGDFNGILEKLDYLNDGNPSTTSDLGVTGIWLMPIYPSPSYHGYNVTDFYAVNPDFGSTEDFKNLLEAAHSRGIRVILDITLNHISTEHPWFIEGKNPESPFHDWFIWSDFDPGYTGSWGQKVWFPYGGEYYYSTFSANFADLNYNNPEVNAEMQKVVRFWLEDIGVDGFRLDAAKHIIEEGTIQANSSATHAWWKSFRTFYMQINPQAMTIGEIWDTTAITAEYLRGDEFDLALDFYLAGLFIQSVNQESSSVANNQLQLSYASVPPLQFAPFLTNHDQNRLMNQLGNNAEKVMVAASLLLTAPGVPFLYYGEEIGMEGQKPDEQIRAPMQWSANTFAGFSTVPPWQPLGTGWQNYNVALETGDPASLLSHYRNLIQTRNRHPALRVGDLNILTTGNDSLCGILRISQEEAVMVLVNLTDEPITDYALSVGQSKLAEGSYTPVLILGKGEFTIVMTDSNGGFSQYIPVAEMPAYGTVILQLQLNAP